MRGRIWVGSLLFVGMLAPAPTPAAAQECGTGQTCAAPVCWDPKVRARPGMARTVLVSCRNALDATLVTPPQHAAVSDVAARWDGLVFTLLPNSDAPRQDEAVFRLDGPEMAIDLHVAIEVVPTSENTPPVCGGDHAAQRTDGSGPVDLYLYPNCYDVDEDDFTIYGAGPGIHSASPRFVSEGVPNEGFWPYRTATHSGAETASVWAVDVLGARSADATLEVTVGPGVDRLPTCAPNGNAWFSGWVGIVPARPGVTRRFEIQCEDPDSDPFSAALTRPPERGALPLFLPDELQTGFWGAEQSIDATYVPTDSSLEPDQFEVTASGIHGEGPRAPMAILPIALPENGGHGCGWNPITATVGVPTDLVGTCSDSHGDKLSAEVVGGPLHGVAGPPVLLPARFGTERIVIPYVPAPGFKGYDCVKVAVTDGHGAKMTVTIDIYVKEAPLPIDLPPVPLPDVVIPPGLVPPLPGSGPPGPGPVGPGAPVPTLRQFVQRHLGTASVRRLSSTGSTDVWLPGRLSKVDLLRTRRAPGALVLCRARCAVRFSSWLVANRQPRSRVTRRKTAFVGQAGEARVVWFSIDGRERRSLRRTRRPKAAFKLLMRDGRQETTAIERRIRVGR